MVRRIIDDRYEQKNEREFGQKKEIEN
jgi:hypothetical protein